MDAWFSRISRAISYAAGTWQAFVIAITIILAWAISGPFFHYSDTWQLYINTGTTLVTFVMVFLIQGSQNHDTAAIQLKLAELIRASAGAHNAMIGLENLSQEELRQLQEHFTKLAEQAQKRSSEHSVREGVGDVAHNPIDKRPTSEAEDSGHRKSFRNG